jgi:hypothetical protein
MLPSTSVCVGQRCEGGNESALGVRPRYRNHAKATPAVAPRATGKARSELEARLGKR